MDQLLQVFIPSAFAESANVPAQGGGLSFFMMMGLLLIFLYFAIWRPQNKRAKEQHNLINSLAKGDEIMTTGGLLGRINKLHDQYISLVVSNNVELIVQKSSVVNILPKGTLKSIES